MNGWHINVKYSTTLYNLYDITYILENAHVLQPE